MKPRYILRSLLLAAGGLTLLASASLAQTTCDQQLTTARTIKLSDNCETAEPIYIPEGHTLDGNGKTITAIENTSSEGVDRFRGGIIRNTFGGRSFNVKNLTVVYVRTGSTCGSKESLFYPDLPEDPNNPKIDDRLVGILFDGASGSVKNTVVLGITRCSGEGNGIEVRNFGPTTTKVTLDGNTVTGYGKTGIVANGNVDVTITGNLVDAAVTGGGPDPAVVINGIQLGYGATGTLRSNTVTGNRTTAGVAASSAGILVFGLDPYCVGITIQANTLVNNDVGVFLSQKTSGGGPPLTKTGIRVAGNTITNASSPNTNSYQAGISDWGNGDKLTNNDISGDGYSVQIDIAGGGNAVPFVS